MKWWFKHKERPLKTEEIVVWGLAAYAVVLGLAVLYAQYRRWMP